MPRKYREIEALKRYQHQHELFKTKFTRRAHGEDRNRDTQSRRVLDQVLPLLNPRFVFYASYAIYFSLAAPLEQSFREDMGWKAARAQIAGDLYDAFTRIVNGMEDYPLDPTLLATVGILQNLITVSTLIQSNIFNANQELGLEESKTLKPIAIKAFIKTIVLLLDNAHLSSILNVPEVRNVIASALGSLPEGSITDPRITNLLNPVPPENTPANDPATIAIQAAVDQYKPTYTLREFALDVETNLLKPHTIAQIAVKLAAIHTMTLQLTYENIRDVLDEFLIATNADMSVIDNAFIQTLINSDIGDTTQNRNWYGDVVSEVSRNMTLKGYLENGSESIEKSVAALIQHRSDKQSGLILTSELRDGSAKNKDIIATFKHDRVNRKRYQHLATTGQMSDISTSQLLQHHGWLNAKSVSPKEMEARKQHEHDKQWGLTIKH